jgi:hypothetical protein
MTNLRLDTVSLYLRASDARAIRRVGEASDLLVPAVPPSLVGSSDGNCCFEDRKVWPFGWRAISQPALTSDSHLCGICPRLWPEAWPRARPWADGQARSDLYDDRGDGWYEPGRLSSL